MNYRLLKPSKILNARPATARQHIVTVLAGEILDSPESKDFRIASEHQLCRRFNVSRVTVRLALGELESRKLIYRRHGKGTFAYGRSTRTNKDIGILLKTPHPSELVEILEGVASVTTPLGSRIILIRLSPDEWPQNLSECLAGVIVVAENVTINDLDNLKNRKLPFFIVGETDLPGPCASISENNFVEGQRMAEALSQIAVTGGSVSDSLQRFALNLELIST
jgi:DNA-binding LacI/PurR family transcriptional regulator